jgi:transcriptional regulator with XRE-family HTH domain
MTVRMARAALGWSQAEFGRFLGMSQRAIHRIEQGHSEPRRTTLLAIESLLRKAGFKIEDRADGGFSMVVPARCLANPRSRSTWRRRASPISGLLTSAPFCKQPMPPRKCAGYQTEKSRAINFLL